MKKIILTLFIILLITSCQSNIEKNNYNEENINKYFKVLEKKYGKGNGYFDLKHGVIELDNMIVLNDLKYFTGKQLIVHIGYTIWRKNSIEILTKLKELNIDMIHISIRDDFNKNNNIISIKLQRKEAILFSSFKTKNKSLSLVMGKYGNGEIICSDEVVKILGVKKEECSIIQISEK